MTSKLPDYEVCRQISVTLPITPSGNRYWRHLKNGRTILSEDARNYREKVGWICLEQHVEPLEGLVRVTIRIYRARKRGDLDNFAKQLLDSCRTHLYADDSNIVELHMYRYDDKDNPRAEVEVTELDS